MTIEIIVIISVIVLLGTGTIMLFWKLSKVAYQVEQNTRDINGMGRALRETLNSKEAIDVLEKTILLKTGQK